MKMTSFARERVLSLLKDGGWYTTVEINNMGGTEGTRRLRELRANGYRIEKRKVAGSTMYEYRLPCLGNPCP